MYSKDTPLEAWLRSGKLEKSGFRLTHTSDVLRFLTLWKYGGLYLDLDVIVVKSLRSNNFACIEQGDYVNAAILGLDTSLGKKVASLCLE